MEKKILLIVALFIVVSNFLSAQDAYWVGGFSNAWEDAENWDIFPEVLSPDDDVAIDGNFTVTIQSNQTIESLRLRNGANLTINTGYTLTVYDNNSDGVKIEETGGSLTVNGTLTSYNNDGYGVKIDSVGSVMTVNGTVNSYDNDDDGVRLSGPGSIVTVNGTINSHHNSKDGIEVKNGCNLIIPSSGKIYINDVGRSGLKLNEDITNDGIISIINSGDVGLDTGGSGDLYNYGTITINGAIIGIDGKDTSWDMENYGTITISNADTLIDDGTDLSNHGTLKGDGYLENGNSGDVNFNPGSTLEPGTSSVGQLTFYEEVDFTGIILNIEIEGNTTPGTDYDNIIVQDGPNNDHGKVTLSGATLNLSGSYTPVPGDEFMIIEKISAGAIDGTFSSYPEGTTFTYKGVELTISYLGGDGNDMTVSNSAPLPVELIDFNARAMENEVKLSWVTATEINNDFFTLERSSDGRSFEKIAKIYGNGSTTEVSKYNFMDENPENGLSYYRLKQTDFDGQFSYSDIESVEFHNEKIVQIYPTIVKDKLTIEVNSNFESELDIVIRDLSGRVFNSLKMKENSGKKELSTTNLNSGTYFITIYNNDFVKTYKFIKL